MSAYIIAELGLNHNGDPELCRDMIDAAAGSGVDAIKFQLISREVNYNLPPGSPLFMAIEKSDLGKEGYQEMVTYGRKKGLQIISSVADLPSVDVFKSLLFDAIKISSSNFSNQPLLAAVCNMKLPIILSAGSADLVQIMKTVMYLKNRQDVEFSLLHCISQYPTNYSDCHLRVIPYLKEFLQVPVGFSDHTLSVEIGAVAVALGATILEKHFTMNRNLEGPDHQASLMPNEMKAYVKNVRDTEMMLGEPGRYFFKEAQNINYNIRRNIVCRNDLPQYSIINKTNLIIARPGITDGIPVPVDMMEIILGRKIQKPIKKWESVCWNHILGDANDPV